MAACPVLVAKYAWEHLKELLARETWAEVPSSKELIYLFCLPNSCVLLPCQLWFEVAPGRSGSDAEVPGVLPGLPHGR